MRGRSALAAFAMIAMIGEPTASAVAQTRRHVYRVDDLGSLGGTYVYGQAINIHGEVAGSAAMPDGTLHAVRWTPSGGLEDLGTNGGVESQASGINDNGDVVGLYFDAAFNPHAFIAPRGGPMRDLSPDILQVSSIANDSRMTGYTTGGHASTTLSDGTVQEISNHVSFGYDINDAGTVAGHGWNSDDLSGPATAFRYSDATGYINLGTLGGPSSGARSVNIHEVVVGWSEDSAGHSSRAFRARPGLPLEDLGTLPDGFAGGLAAASGINDAGEIVGYSDAPSGWAAVVYTDAHGIIDLRQRIPIADRVAGLPHEAVAINSAGQILAVYSGPSGSGTMRLTPVRRIPPPVITAIGVDPLMLWPPNGRMVSVSLDPAVTDVYDPEPACRITAVTNSDHPYGWIDRDIEITQPLTVRLRASERGGQGPGRTYTTRVRCASYLGAAATAEVVVPVRNH